jgi:hypothetical protein
MATTDVPGTSATPGATGHPKGSPAERIKLLAQKAGQDLETIYQECHELTEDAQSPECQAVRAIQTAVAELGVHIGKGLHAEAPVEEPPMEEPPMPPEAPMEGPPMGGSPFAEAARGFRQDMMGSVPPGATPLP